MIMHIHMHQYQYQYRFYSILLLLAKTTRATYHRVIVLLSFHHSNCQIDLLFLLFIVFDNHASHREFIFYEIWRSEEALDSYYKELIKLLGKNSPGKIFPDKINDFIEEEGDILHQEISEA